MYEMFFKKKKNYSDSSFYFNIASESVVSVSSVVLIRDSASDTFLYNDYLMDEGPKVIAVPKEY